MQLAQLISDLYCFKTRFLLVWQGYSQVAYKHMIRAKHGLALTDNYPLE